MVSGYSGTPLAKKLSLRDGMRTWWDGMPGQVRTEIESDGLRLDILAAPQPPIEAGHIFVTSREEMMSKIAELRPLLASSGFLWVSWPKLASGVPTDLTGNVVRSAVLSSTDLVDVKVCAVNDTWSGLKLMIRRNRRQFGK